LQLIGKGLSGLTLGFLWR